MKRSGRFSPGKPMKIDGQTWYQWARELFEYEWCAECGKGVRNHTPAIGPTGHWFALCNSSPEDDG